MIKKYEGFRDLFKKNKLIIPVKPGIPPPPIPNPIRFTQIVINFKPAWSEIKIGKIPIINTEDDLLSALSEEKIWINEVKLTGSAFMMSDKWGDFENKFRKFLTKRLPLPNAVPDQIERLLMNLEDWGFDGKIEYEKDRSPFNTKIAATMRIKSSDDYSIRPNIIENLIKLINE